MQFEQEVVSLEASFHSSKLITNYNELYRYAQNFSSSFSQTLNEIKEDLNFKLSSLPQKAPEQHWTEAIMDIRNTMRPIEEMIKRMGEMVNFVKAYDHLPTLALLEVRIIARLKNEITAEEFKLCNKLFNSERLLIQTALEGVQ
jgi:DNA-directed RNA polymerase subunit F